LYNNHSTPHRHSYMLIHTLMVLAGARSRYRSTDAQLPTNHTHPLAMIDFRCPTRDESTPSMKHDVLFLDNCCCRVKCLDSRCSAAHDACRSESACIDVQRAGNWATLKAAPMWWHGAPGVRKCQALEQQLRGLPSKSARRVENLRAVALRATWRKHHCDEYIVGEPKTAKRTHKLVYDIGFHSGDDTLYFLQRGYDVVAIDGNPTVITDGLTRPALRIAKQTGQLRALARGIVKSVTHENQTLIFYVHRKISEWSTFNKPSPDKLSAFDEISVPVTTCGTLIRRYGTPFYMKVDIEGFDGACLGTLEPGRLPAYVSTEDPLQLEHLLKLGYRSFKMVSQARTRLGGHQFSGGFSEEAPGTWGDAASIRAHPHYSVEHMHVRIDKLGNRIREEHDLHARFAA